jgi:hypothetical protein
MLSSGIETSFCCTGLYHFHLRRQRADLASFHKDEGIPLPIGLDYDSIEGLSFEVKDRLRKTRPESLVSNGIVHFSFIVSDFVSLFVSRLVGIFRCNQVLPDPLVYRTCNLEHGAYRCVELN